MTALAVKGLSVWVGSGADRAKAVDGVSFAVERGECLGLVGESGSGKSLTLRAIMGLLPRRTELAGGELLLDDTPYEPARVRGRGISMIFQEPQSALNPLVRAGELIAEAARAAGLDRAAARRRSIELMEEVGIADAERRARAWPHELSGGQRQRVMIAMALATEPEVLLCDEPTTALDVTIQGQIIDLLNRLRRERQLAMVFVTHDLSLLGRISQRAAVMYAGKLVETGPIAEVIERPRHPYTRALLDCVPSAGGDVSRLRTIPGHPPDPRRLPPGCRFAPRCELATDACRAAVPALASVGPATSQRASCIHTDQLDVRDDGDRQA